MRSRGRGGYHCVEAPRIVPDPRTTLRAGSNEDVLGCGVVVVDGGWWVMQVSSLAAPNAC